MVSVSVLRERHDAARPKEDDMTIYLIRGETVTAQAAAPAKPAKGSLTIRSADDIASSDLPVSRLVAIWNALPGAAPVTKFKDRKTAARRLWAAFQQIAPSPGKKSARGAGTPAMTKQAQVIVMLQRPAGATIDEIVTLTAWQRHTVRGLIAGALKKKLGLDVISEKEERGRVYRIVGATERAA
jgi:hypothetical protein